MGVRSKRLWGPTSVGAGTSVIYTCPVGETALIKQLEIGPGTIGSLTVTFYLNGAGSGNRIHQAVVPNNGWLSQSGLFIVLADGDVLRASGGTTSVVVTGFGAELEGVAD